MENQFEVLNSTPVERLTPEDIEATEFELGLRGYDPASVRSFLRQVAIDYRAIHQSSQLAAIALEEAKQEALAIDEKTQHADLQLEEAKRLREDASIQAEEALNLVHAANRARDEAREELQRIVEEQAATPVEAPVDPYGVASQQIAAIMKAAEASSLELRKESEEIVAAAQLTSDKIVSDAKQTANEAEMAARIVANEVEAYARENAEKTEAAARELAEQIQGDARRRAEHTETTARRKADLEAARAAAAQEHTERLVEAMKEAQGQVQLTVANAIAELKPN